MSAAELGTTYSEDHKEKLRDEYNRAYIELRKTTGIGAYVVSNEVAQVLARLAKRSRIDLDSKTPWFEIFDADYAAYKNALREIRLLAKRDLRIPDTVSGYARLGIVLSGVWLISMPTAYFSALAVDSVPLTSRLRSFYDWVPGSRAAAPGELGHNIGFVPDVPVPNFLVLGLICVMPVLIGWLALYVLPRSARWVRNGFPHKNGDAA